MRERAKQALASLIHTLNVRLVLIALVAGTLLLTNAAGALEPDSKPIPPTPASRQPIRIEAAPGGGEMITVAPGNRYVTRGQVQADGTVRVGCGRDPTDSAGAGQ